MQFGAPLPGSALLSEGCGPVGASWRYIQQIPGWTEVNRGKEHRAVACLPSIGSPPGAGRMVTGAQESLDFPNHGSVRAMLLNAPQPVLCRHVGPGQPETHNDRVSDGH